jgi:PST family polysaccharide transporter
MNLFKTSFYTSISTAITFICGFIVAKVVAVKIGPAGIAMVGQFQNTTSILAMLGAGAVNMGVVKYISENKGDRAMQQRILTHALSIVLICSGVITLFVILASGWLSKLAFHTTDYAEVYLLFGIFLSFTTLNSLSNSIFNGLQEIKKLTISNISFSILGIVFTVLFAYLWGVKGVLVAVNGTAFMVFLVNCYLYKHLHGFNWKPSFLNWDNKVIRQLFTFTMMSVISSLVLPSIQLIVRNKIIREFSITEAGYWQGVTRISDYYLTFITTVLSVYYLPRLSEISDKGELRKEIFRGYKMILPVVGLLALLIWLFRHYVVLILFSPEFLPMKPLFTFQLLGDFIKISSWLLGFLMWAKAMIRPFLITEIVFSTTYVLLSIFFIDNYGLIGATFAFALNYTLYLITMLFVMKKYIL